MALDKSVSWKSVSLNKIVDYEQPNKYIIKKPLKKDSGITSVLTPNKSFIKGYTDEKDFVFENIPVIIFDDFTADNKYVNFSFKVKSSAMKILKARDNSVNLKFIFYQLQTKKVNTSTHKRYYLSVCQYLKFLMPMNSDDTFNYEIQESIVEEIEKQFTRLDASFKILINLRNKIKIYKKAVLDFNFKDIPTSKFLNEISDVIDIDHKMPSKVKDGVAFISPKDFFEPDGIDFSNAKQISKEDFNRLSKKCNPKYGDIIFSRIGTIGKVRKVPRNKIFQISYSLCLIKPKRFQDTNYLYWVLQSPIILRQAYKGKKSIGVPDLGLTEIRNFVIPYIVNEIEQEKIVQEIESRFSVIDKIEEIVNQSLKKTELLKKAILKNAFEGKLVKLEH